MLFQHGVVPDATTYSATINACEKGQQWQYALSLLLETLSLFSARSWPTPQRIPALAGEGVVWIDCGEKFTAAHTISGHLLCFGDNTEGQCAKGDRRAIVPKPSRVRGTPPVMMLALGAAHVIAITQPPPQAPPPASEEMGGGIRGNVSPVRDESAEAPRIRATDEDPRAAKQRLRSWGLRPRARAAKAVAVPSLGHRRKSVAIVHSDNTRHSLTRTLVPR